jgi:hypothetical protein
VKEVYDDATLILIGGGGPKEVISEKDLILPSFMILIGSFSV